jgi:hypothetical protein
MRKGVNMKKIHELLDEVDINEEININIEDMSLEEKQNILNLTLQKSGINKKATKRRLILPIAAAFTLILSFAAVFAQGGISTIYYKLFGENIRYVNEMGTVINESHTSNGITFNVANMLGDENSFYIIFQLIKEDGESFKDSDYIYFDSLNLNIGSGGYTWYQIEDDDASDNKATFILAGNTKKKIVGDKLTLIARDFTEYSIIEPTSPFDPYDFLTNNSEYLNQEVIKNKDKTPVTNNNLHPEEQEKEELIYNLTPNYVLPWKYSKIFVDDNSKDVYIDNIGFVENKLCIRFAQTNSEDNSIGEIYFVNKNDSKDILYDEFVITDDIDGIEYSYYIFNLKNVNELKNYKLYYNIVNKLSSTTGTWEVKFKANYKNTSKIIKVNKETDIEGNRYTVKNIKVSPIAINVEMSNNLLDKMNNLVYNLSNGVSVVMKDGSTVEVSESGSNTNTLISTVNLMFKQPIDMKQIDKVIIGNIEVFVDL